MRTRMSEDNDNNYDDNNDDDNNDDNDDVSIPPITQQPTRR